ncbi:electron transfer flavoprotein alpha subunit apoprotein [Brevibacterium sanguinis]|uniref:Electron transfer flavoprotein alpha subunit apoprotein n=2 Tax=Brevibacterium TaxID=1696 RepID=A0A366ILE5_9MICO|nr:MULTISPECIES: electron transfer flavoprotein subunit alpha/FixB family protein [Brevibacterium]RBP67011.1 electron transfer flavoprotein alpha subunit apoprotein [Brevibacterium sanguinis]RBP73536.1 electron transfer flavoprotein alpha subunit apoprotein [Brevibacterium celere]
MSEVLVYADHADGTVAKSTLELLTLARRIGTPVAVVVNAGDAAAQIAQSLGEYGAEAVLTADDSVYSDYLVAPAAELLASLVGSRSPAAVLLSSSFEGKEIAGRLSVKTNSGVITDAVDIDSDLVATQSVFAGGYTVRGRVTAGTPIITVKPNSVAPEAAAAAGSVEAVSADISEAAKTAKVVATEDKPQTGRPNLTEAAIVVSGGRGTGGDFGPVEALADSLGAAVGASRAAVDAGWYPHANQVGQTGKTVSPQLYVAAGISGAIQHRAGMQTSKTIVAINKDDEAPIFELVDFGVVGDLFQVLPQAAEAITARK